MAKVIAILRGYYGGIIRETGDVFGVDDEIMADPKRRPRWVKPASAEVVEAAGADETETEDHADDKPKKGKGGRKAKPETVQAPETQPFADAPAPVRAKSEINDALGTTQPDWLAPGGKPAAVTD